MRGSSPQGRVFPGLAKWQYGTKRQTVVILSRFRGVCPPAKLGAMRGRFSEYGQFTLNCPVNEIALRGYVARSAIYNRPAIHGCYPNSSNRSWRIRPYFRPVLSRFHIVDTGLPFGIDDMPIASTPAKSRNLVNPLFAHPNRCNTCNNSDMFLSTWLAVFVGLRP